MLYCWLPAVQVRLIPSGQPAAPPWLVCPRREGLEYFVEHHSGRLLLLSNARGAEDYALFRWSVGRVICIFCLVAP